MRLAGGVVLDDELHVTGDGHLFALGAANEGGLQLVEFNLEVAGHRRQNLGMATCCGNLKWLEAFRALFHVNELTWLHSERGAVNDFAVNENVTVYDQLACL